MDGWVIVTQFDLDDDSSVVTDWLFGEYPHDANHIADAEFLEDWERGRGMDDLESIMNNSSNWDD